MEGMRTGLQHRVDRALQRIESQHGQLREISDEIDRAFAAGGETEIERWLLRFRDALRSHFELEEEILFPGAADLLGPDKPYFRSLVEEHARMLDMLDLLVSAGTGGSETRIDALGRFRLRLRVHEQEEESLVRRALAANGFAQPPRRDPSGKGS